MLQLVGYDLSEPRYPDALERGVKACGTGINLFNGPWILSTDKSPREVCQTIAGELAAAGSRNDKLLVLPIGSGVNGVGRTPPARRDVDSKGDAEHVAIAYTLHSKAPKTRVPASRWAQVQKAVDGLGEGCGPVHALRLVKTDLSPTAVHNLLDQQAELYHYDELLVVEVPNLESAELRGACYYNAPEAMLEDWWQQWVQGLEWLEEQGLLRYRMGSGRKTAAA